MGTRSMCQAGVDFEVPEPGGADPAGLEVGAADKADRRGGAGRGRAARPDSRLAFGLYTTDNGEPPAFLSWAGRPQLSPHCFSPAWAEPRSISASPLDGDILANLNHRASAGSAARQARGRREASARFLGAHATENAGALKPKLN